MATSILDQMQCIRDANKNVCMCRFANFQFSNLHLAVLKADMKEIKQLIKLGCNLNAIVVGVGAAKGFTALHLAVDLRNADAVEILLKNGADFTIEDASRRTVLHLACQKQVKNIMILIMKAYLAACSTLNSKVKRVLADRKIPTDFDIKFSDDFLAKFRPLHFAIRFQLTEILITLIECGVSVKETDYNGMTAFHCLIEEYSTLYADSTREGIRMLHRTIRKYVKERVLPSTLDRINAKLFRLFEANCRGIKDLVDNFGRTPMFYLYDGLRLRESFYYEMTFNGDLKWRYDTGIQGWERVNMVRRLLRWPTANVLATDYEGNTILHALAGVVFPHRHTSSGEEVDFLVEEYLAAGGDIDALNHSGFTALQLNCRVHNSEVAESFLKHGADINFVSPEGETPYSEVRRAQLESTWPRWDIYSFTLFTYLKRLTILGAPVCAINMEVFERDNKELESIFNGSSIKDGKIVFTDDPYHEELARMKAKKLDAYTSLYDVLRKDVSDLVHHASNAKLYESEFLEDYKLYGYLVRNKLDEAKARAELIGPSTKILRWIVNRDLPDACVHEILSNFSNNDLKDLSKTADNKVGEDKKKVDNLTGKRGRPIDEDSSCRIA